MSDLSGHPGHGAPDPDRDLGSLLGDAFDARARTAVPDTASAPARRTTPSAAGPAHRRWQRIAAPLAAAAAVLLAVGAGVALTADDEHRGTGAAGPGTGTTAVSPSARGSSPATGSASPLLRHAAPGASPVKVVLADQERTVGVGMPVVARFSARITDARAFAAATTVTADGRPLDARWFFLPSTTAGYPMEAHLRPEQYWPAHATIVVRVASAQLSAGTGFGFANGLTAQFTTGAQTIATVDNRTHRMTVRTDGKPVASYAVSLGAAATPTLAGVKVVMAKARSVCLHDVNGAYNECNVRDAQQLTATGEYLHAAPWNLSNIGVRNTSNGCTNLTPADAAKLYGQLEVGDIVVYPNASGATMRLTEGIGDWDVPWSTWVTGGLLPTS